MKKVLAIAVLVLLASTVAMASATNWMLYIQTDSEAGTDFGVKAQLGVKPLGNDNYDSYDLTPVDFASSGPNTKWAGFPISGDTSTTLQPNAYSRNYKSSADYTTYGPEGKKWAFRVAGLSASVGTIRVQFQTGTSTATRVVQPTVGQWGYFVKLVSNQGQPIVRPAWAASGAGQPWVPGTAIEITVPVANSAYFGQMILPELKISPNDNGTFLANGYQFEFIQGPLVPEPASLMVLGTGLVGLVGFVSRRRRV